MGPRPRLESVMDFACGSGSLLLNVRKRMGPHGIGKIYGQEKNITTYNLARMNMLLHGVKDTEFEIFHGDTLTNDWDMLRELNPAKKPMFDAVVANPPFSYRWDNSDALADDVRFKNHGLAPKSAADFAFLLHGFHFLKEQGVMAIILPHGVLFRGGAQERIRAKAAQGWAHRHRDWSAVQPVLFHRHSGLHPGAEEVQKAGRRAVHQCERARALRQRQASEPADRRAHHQDHQDLPVSAGRIPVCPPGDYGRDREERLQPEYLTVRQHDSG
jgi:N-6 DNA Methylase